LYATQFHPEVAHTEYGQQIIRTFLHDIAGIPPVWTMVNIIEETVEPVREQVGDAASSAGFPAAWTRVWSPRCCTAPSATSSRASSSTTACSASTRPSRSSGSFRDQFHIDLVHVDAEERYLSLLAGVTDPEEKRRIIGEEFWQVFFEEATKLEGVTWLAQGTLYPDVIESGNKTAAKIKSHHNLIPFPSGVHFDLIEPLKALFKDEVRAVGARARPAGRDRPPAAVPGSGACGAHHR
jgi:GMP synthase (glutamine-hydrolysing)